MLRSLRVPERLFALATWAVSILFASFLIGLGGKLVADLPGVRQSLAVDQFADAPRLARVRAERDTLVRRERERTDARERAQLAQTAAENAYQAARAGFQNWVATRTATTDPRQDPEVLQRTRALDQLGAGARDAQAEVERLDAELLRLQQARVAADDREGDLLRDASTRYERARFWQELRVFLVRLALTLPLLVVAGGLVARKRRSEYWPLARGFVLFALFAFFVELVPYLPSYGGYVRYGVGVLATAVAGVWVVRAMRRYLARRAEVEAQSEPERRRRLGYEEAIKRLNAGVCPGCERPVGAPATPGAPAGPTAANYCVHCGMHLYDECRACATRKNAFYPYCPTCGVPAAGPPLAEASPAGA
jgi:hypothetical protein